MYKIIINFTHNNVKNNVSSDDQFQNDDSVLE